jgi:hypothetical protein
MSSLLGIQNQKYTDNARVSYFFNPRKIARKPNVKWYTKLYDKKAKILTQNCLHCSVSTAEADISVPTSIERWYFSST